MKEGKKLLIAERQRANSFIRAYSNLRSSPLTFSHSRSPADVLLSFSPPCMNRLKTTPHTLAPGPSRLLEHLVPLLCSRRRSKHARARFSVGAPDEQLLGSHGILVPTTTPRTLCKRPVRYTRRGGGRRQVISYFAPIRFARGGGDIRYR